MKKICILSNGLVFGGTDTFVINLVNGMDTHKFDITVALSIDDDSLALREHEIIKAGAKTVWTHGVTGVSGKLKHFVRLYKILKAGKFDAFQTNIDLFNGVNLFVAWLAGVPVRVCHSHNSQQGKEVVHGRTLPIVIYQKIMKWLCWHFSNRRCGCSALAMDFLYGDKWRNDSNSMIVYNGIDLGKYENTLSADENEGLKNNLGLSSPYNILTVGRLDAQKNPLFIVDCFVALRKIRQDCHLVWVGSGEMEADIVAKIESKGIATSVSMLGVRDDVDKLMKSCDVFFLPSLFEGLGIVLIEAQAAGLPCGTSYFW